MNVKIIATCVASVWLLAGCGIAVPIQVGPRDLDVSSPQAPQCGQHPYPFTALSNAEEGLVLVKAQVDAAGAVGQVAVTKATLSPLLNQAALDAVRRCRFATTAAAAPREVKVTVVYAIVGADDKMPVGVVRIGLQPDEAAR